MISKILPHALRAGLIFLWILLPACTPSPAPIATTPATSEPVLLPTETLPPPETSSQASADETTPTAKPTHIPVPTLPPAVGPALAYLKDRDIWMVDEPGSAPYPLTVAGDIMSFAWALNAERLAAFNGRTLCFFHRDGSVRTACLELGLTDDQALVERRLAISPDQRWVVLWNPGSPPQEGQLGWIIVALDSTNTMYRIEDPIDWGADLTDTNEPGGFTGEPVFLPDGRLVGALSHRSLCESQGCPYRVFEFDLQNRLFSPFDQSAEELSTRPISNGSAIELASDGRLLIEYGVLFEDCEAYSSRVDSTVLASGDVTSYSLDGENLVHLNYHPELNQAVLARAAGCRDPELQTWATACKLTADQEILPMQLWTPGSDESLDLPPGISPAWSPNADWIVFESCLAQDSAGIWQTDGNALPTLFLTDPSGQVITAVDQGDLPQWQPPN